MVHLGDITKIDGHEIPEVDVIIGGSPRRSTSCRRKVAAGRLLVWGRMVRRLPSS